MNDRDIRELVRLGTQEVALPLQIATSNSWRRVVDRDHAEVLTPITQRSDGHPDLMIEPAVQSYLLDAANAFPAVASELLESRARIADLERQLAEARACLGDMAHLADQLSASLNSKTLGRLQYMQRVARCRALATTETL